MELKDITLTNVGSFLSGTYQYLKFQLNALEPHIKEQFYLRIIACQATCLQVGVCADCQCSVPSRMLVDKEDQKCPFPNLMSPANWELYKTALNISSFELKTQAELVLKALA